MVLKVTIMFRIRVRILWWGWPADVADTKVEKGKSSSCSGDLTKSSYTLQDAVSTSIAVQRKDIEGDETKRVPFGRAEKTASASLFCLNRGLRLVNHWL